eukprot:gene16466-18099_t
MSSCSDLDEFDVVVDAEELVKWIKQERHYQFIESCRKLLNLDENGRYISDENNDDCEVNDDATNSITSDLWSDDEIGVLDDVSMSDDDEHLSIPQKESIEIDIDETAEKLESVNMDDK